MAELGFRTINEMVGRCDCSKWTTRIDHWKARGLDLSPILTPAAKPRPDVEVYCTQSQNHGLEDVLDNKLIEECWAADQRGNSRPAQYPDREHRPRLRHDAQPSHLQELGDPTVFPTARSRSKQLDRPAKAWVHGWHTA